MGHGKETPRQKMIGMMYLVLMAMLALNVSNEVLNAFAVLDNGLNKTKSSIEQTTDVIMKEFGSQFGLNPQKVGRWYEMAQAVKLRSDSMVNFIQDRKIDILLAAKEDTTKVIHHGTISLEAVKAKDKTDAPAIVMIGDNNDKAGSKLKKDLNAYKEFILNDVLLPNEGNSIRASIQESLNTDDEVVHDKKTDWARSRFEHLPQSGVLSIMTGIQINIRNAEAEVLKYLYRKIDEGTFKFTDLDATVIPNSSYIIKGNDYNAEVFIAARDSTATPVIYVTESPNPYDSVQNSDGTWKYERRLGLEYKKITADTKTGKAVYTVPGNTTGSRYWGGIIELVGPAGDTIARPFRRSYIVAQGAVTVAPTKMNVFYIGVDNPVDISVAGVKPEDVSASMTNGRIRKKGNSYVVNPKRPGNSYVTVAATIDGQRRTMQRKEFRVKRVPDPIAKINGKKGGGITKQAILVSPGVEAVLENFLFDLKYRVTGFKISFTQGVFLKEAVSKSYKFSNKQKQLLQTIQKNTKLYIEDIKAVGPDGTVRNLPAIALTVL